MSDLPPHAAEAEAWNRAHDRLARFLGSFALEDHRHVSHLVLELLDQARALHRAHPEREPVEVTMEHARAVLAGWLARNLTEKEPPSRVMGAGYVALLLSRLYCEAPGAFLRDPLPEELRESMRRTLVVTGPDLNISSMTPRRLDYGPMLDLARETWHRWDAKTFFIALAFWAAVYVVLYLWLSGGF